MPEVFYGEWAVAVVSHESAYNQRYIITGSDASDGTYLVGNPPPVNVFGAQWTLTIEYECAGRWQAGKSPRTPPHTAPGGRVLRGGADLHSKGDHDEMVLTSPSPTPPLNPWRPVVNPYDFTLNEKTLEKFLR